MKKAVNYLKGQTESKLFLFLGLFLFSLCATLVSCGAVDLTK